MHDLGRPGNEGPGPSACELAQALQTPRRWLITGVAGFVGSHLLQRLLLAGHKVRGLDSFVTGSKTNLARVRAWVGPKAWANFELVQGDVRCLETCIRSARGAEFVLHQAALGSVPRSIDRPRQTQEVNVSGTQNIFRAAAHFGQRVVYASSSSVYGNASVFPNRVGCEGRCLSPYAESKLQNERDAQAFHADEGLPSIGLRYFNVFGPRQRAEGPYLTVWPNWLHSFGQGQAPIIYGDGTIARDYCPVQQVVQANLRAALLGTRPIAVYNVGLGQSRTMLDLFDALKEAFAELGQDVTRLEPCFAPGRTGDVKKTCADLSRIREDLNYRIELNFEQGCRQLVKHHLAYRMADRPLTSRGPTHAFG